MEISTVYQNRETASLWHPIYARYMEFLQYGRNLSEESIIAYKYELLHFTSWLESGNYTASSLSRELIHKYIADYITQNTPLDTTVRRKIASLRGFFKFLLDIGVIATNPFLGFSFSYKSVRRLPRVMMAEEFRLLLNAAFRYRINQHSGSIFEFRAVRNRAILELLCETGMRVGEAAGLNRDDINFEDGTIRICGKGGKERILFIVTKEVQDALIEYRNVRPAFALADSSTFFTDVKGNRLAVGTMWQMFKKYINLAGITRHYSPHAIRHTVATMLLNNGADIRIVQSLLGHASITTTQIYTHVSPQSHRNILRQYGYRARLRISGADDGEKTCNNMQ